jgi:hypothetical protein
VAGGGSVHELVSTAVVPGARAHEVLRFMLEPADLDEHVRTEFARLGAVLSGGRSR